MPRGIKVITLGVAIIGVGRAFTLACEVVAQRHATARSAGDDGDGGATGRGCTRASAELAHVVQLNR